MSEVIIRTQIRMPEDLYRQLRDVARSNGTNISRICCAALRSELGRPIALSGPIPANTRKAIDDLIEGVISDVAARHADAGAMEPPKAPRQ